MQLNLQDMSDNIKFIQSGILYINKSPVYVIERLQSATEDYLFVYRPRLDTNGEPIKDYDVLERVIRKDGKPATISGDNFISRTLLKAVPHKVERYTEPKPPLYVSPVVEFEDSVTDEFGKGFFVREEDEYDSYGRVIKSGEPTRTFILLKNIDWIDSYVPIEGILDEYRLKLEEREYLYGRGNERL